MQESVPHRCRCFILPLTSCSEVLLIHNQQNCIHAGAGTRGAKNQQLYCIQTPLYFSVTVARTEETPAFELALDVTPEKNERPSRTF